MPTPSRVNGLQWELSSPQERRQLLDTQQETEQAEGDSSAPSFAKAEHPADRLTQTLRHLHHKSTLHTPSHSFSGGSDATSPSEGAQKASEPETLTRVAQQIKKQFTDRAQDKNVFHAMKDKLKQASLAQAENASATQGASEQEDLARVAQQIKQQFTGHAQNKGMYDALKDKLKQASLLQAENASATQGASEQEDLARITQQFQQRFADSAQNKEEFHALMQKSFGDQYDPSKAEGESGVRSYILH